MDWYYTSNGQQTGPVSQQELAELFRNGAVKPLDLVWNETMAEWTAIGRITDFVSSSPRAAASAARQGFPSLLTPTAPEEPKPVGSPVPQGMPEPPSYLWQSIVVTVLCCLPLGIPAIIFSTKVKPAYVSGDYQGSLNASKKAKMWCLIALILGLIPLPVGMGSYMMVNVLRDAEEGKVKGDIQTLKASLIRYKTRGGQYPTTEQGLKALVTKPSDGPQPKSYKNLLSEQALYDPWGNLYQYRIPGKRSSEEYDIYSLGRDGQEGTEDDIGNW